MNAVEYIKRCEGSVKRGDAHIPYRCPAGALTIGYGHNLDAKGISERAAEYLLREDLLEVEAAAKRCVKTYSTLEQPRKMVICSMIFQMGEGGFSKFSRTIQEIERGNYNIAARNMLESKWARDLKQWAKGKRTRAEREAEMMRTGEWPKEW